MFQTYRSIRKQSNWDFGGIQSMRQSDSGRNQEMINNFSHIFE